MRDANGVVVLLDVLATRASRVEGVEPQVLVLDLEVDLVGFRQNRHSRRRRVDAALGLGLRHALYAVYAALVLKPPVHAAPADLEHDLLEAADVALVRVQYLDAPALPLGVATVHAEEVACEQPSLVAARRCPDLDDDVFVVERALGDQRPPQLRLEFLDPRFVSCDLLARQLDELRVATLLDDPARLRQRFVDVPVLLADAHDLAELRVLPRELLQAGRSRP